MKNQLQVFENKEFGTIRVIEKNGQPWFVGKDVADVLAYQNSRDALKVHVYDEDKANVVIHDGSQNRRMAIINESGLYRLIFTSKLPAARNFTRWVTSDVLPSIRKHGAYIADDTLRKMREDSAFRDELLQRLSDEKSTQLDSVEKLAPKARYCDVILQCENAVQVSIIAKDYGMTAATFNKLLNGLKIQYKMDGTWLLYSTYMNEGYTISRTYHVNETQSTIHTYWTQRGRWFLYDILKWCGILPCAERPGRAVIWGDGHICP